MWQHWLIYVVIPGKTEEFKCFNCEHMLGFHTVARKFPKDLAGKNLNFKRFKVENSCPCSVIPNTSLLFVRCEINKLQCYAVQKVSAINVG